MAFSKKFGLGFAIALCFNLSLLWAVLPAAQLPTAAQQSNPEHVLKTAAYGWRPFIYEEVSGGTRSIAGLDVQLANLAFAKMGYGVQYKGEENWDELLKDLKTGKKDIVISASKRPEREEYAYYSDVFRASVNVLYLPRDAGKKYRIQNVDQLLKMLDEKAFRLGVVKGRSYGQAAIDAYINSPANSTRIVKFEADEALFNSLEKGQLDGFLIDQIAGADISSRKGFRTAAEESPVRISELPYYVIFSKKTVSPSLVKEFNDSLTILRKTGEYNQQVRQYSFPLLLEFTIGQKWYFFVELTGVIAFAISGLIVAHREKYGIWKTFVLAVLPGVGGGVIRDIFTRRATLELMHAPVDLIAVILTIAAGYSFIYLADRLQRGIKQRRAALQVGSDLYLTNTYLQTGTVKLPLAFSPLAFPVSRSRGTLLNFARRPNLLIWIDRVRSHPLIFTTLVELLDAIGLSTLSVIGVIVAFEIQSDPLWLWGAVFAAITSAGGSILRDMVRVALNHASLKGFFYPLIAAVWGLIFSIFLIWYSNRLSYYPSEIFLAALCLIAGSCLTQLAAILPRITAPSHLSYRS
jgi:polar amino acid transport system substrate-binding protein